MVVFVAALGLGAFRTGVVTEILRLGVASPIWSAVYRAESTPQRLRELMRDEAVRLLDHVPVGSDLWRALKADTDVPEPVRRRMERDWRVRENVQKIASEDHRPVPRSGKSAQAPATSLGESG